MQQGQPLARVDIACDGPQDGMRNESQSNGMPRGAATHTAAAGPISLHEIYRLEDAKRRLGWSDSALRAAKRRGLRLLASGKRRYVTGREVLRFLQAETAAE
jgi:hypothetical protein